MGHFAFLCCSYPLNTQVLLYDVHGSHFDERALNITIRHNIKYFILKDGYSVHDHKNNKGTNIKLNNL